MGILLPALPPHLIAIYLTLHPLRKLLDWPPWCLTIWGRAPMSRQIYYQHHRMFTEVISVGLTVSLAAVIGYLILRILY